MMYTSKDSVITAVASTHTHNSTRLLWVDAARGIAIIAIVIGHTLVPGGGAIFTWLYSFHVPLFFIISGVLRSKCKIGLIAFIKTRAVRLLVPYVLFGILGICVYVFLGQLAATTLGRGNGALSIVDCLVGLVYANGGTGNMKFYSALWFLPCLFVLEIIIALILYVIANIHINRIYLFIMLALVFVCLGWVYVCLLDNFYLPFGIDTAIFMAPFYCLGMALSSAVEVGTIETRLKSIKFKVRILGGLVTLAIFALGCVCAFLNYSITGNTIDYPTNSFGLLPLFYIAALAQTAAIVVWLTLIGKFHILDRIGRYTLPILVLHKYPIWLFQVAIPPTHSLLAVDNLPTVLLVAAVSVFLCMLVGHILIKYLPEVFGRKR